MSRHSFTWLLHWTAALSLLFLLSVDDRIYGGLAWVFIASGGALVVIWALRGLLNGPGPALTGPLRVAHPWLSRGMYLLLGWSVLSLALASLGHALPGPHPRSLLLALGGAAMGHAIFHLWRHTALRDGALRRMTPRALHRYL